MEALIFALIATRKGYFHRDPVVPEPAEFRSFDLRALARSYEGQDDSANKPSGRQNTLVTQVAS
jgi:hypothetical protein